jgi:rod shape-determining protein MreC
MRNLIAFLQRFHFFILFLILETVAIIIIASNNSYQGSTIQGFANEFGGGITNRYNNLTDYVDLRETNRILAEENTRLRRQIESSYIKYTHHTFTINDTIYKQQYTFIDAKVISSSSGKRNNYMMLNKGSIHGVKKSMAVISSNGIVGIVSSVSKNYSKVMMVLHSESRISAKLKRTNYSGSLIWKGGNYRYGLLTDIPSHIDIKKGDTVITSGFSLDFPEGIMIGRIENFKQDPGTSTYEGKVKFSADYNKLDYVYIVRNLFKEEQQTIMNTEQ